MKMDNNWNNQNNQNLQNNNWNNPNNNWNNQMPPQQPAKGFAVASLVLGIIGVVCMGWLWGVLAIIFAAVAKSKGNKSGMATAGLVLGIIALVVGIIITVLMGSLYAELLENVNDLDKLFRQLS